jgi:hypothetical protein
MLEIKGVGLSDKALSTNSSKSRLLFAPTP